MMYSFQLLLLLAMSLVPVVAGRRGGGARSPSSTATPPCPTKMPQHGILDERDFPYGWGLEGDICLLGAPTEKNVKQVKRGE